MYMRRIIISAILLLGICQVVGQNIKRPESYNYQRGLEAMQEEKLQEALDYFNKDLKDNPKNGYAYSWIAMLRGQNEEYGRALTAADLAIEYLPKKDAEYVIFAYTTRAGVYLHLGDTIKAMSDYALAIKAKPDESDRRREQTVFTAQRGFIRPADIVLIPVINIHIISRRTVLGRPGVP